MATDPIEVQQLRHCVAHPRLKLAHRRLIRACQLGAAAVRRRQRAPVQLAVRGHRQRVQTDIARGQHVLRQFGGKRRTQVRFAVPITFGDAVRHQALASGLVGQRGDTTGTDRGERGQHRLDLRRFDPVTADLDLIVHATDELQHAVRPQADQVAGAIEAPAVGRKPVRHEAFCRQRRLAQIATGHAFSADMELAGDTLSHRLAAGVEHQHAGGTNRPADRHTRRAGGEVVRDRPGARERGALGGSVAVVQASARCAGEHAPHVGHRQRLAAGEQLAQARQVCWILIDHRIEQCGRQPRRGDPMRGNASRQACAGGRGLVMHHDAAPVEQRPPEFQGRRVKAQGRGVQHARIRTQLDVIHVAHQVDDRAVADLHALGLPGRPGRVHHVGQRSAVDGRRGCDFRVACFRLARPARDHRYRLHRCGPSAVTALPHQHHGCARVVQHERQTIGRLAGVQRQVGCAAFQHRQQRHHRCR